MEAKCNSHQYRIAEEFRADAQLIVHNTVIFHGGKLLQEFHYASIIYIAVNFGSAYVGCPNKISALKMPWKVENSYLIRMWLLYIIMVHFLHFKLEKKRERIPCY